MKLIVVLMLFTLVGCSRNGNPVHFSKIEPPVASVKSDSNPTPDFSNVTAVFSGTPEDQMPKTILEFYLNGVIDRDYMMAWFFKEPTTYRDKVFDVTYEIREKEPLSKEDRKKILDLEKQMNNAIRRFNERDMLVRGGEVFSAAWESTKDISDRDLQYNLAQIKQQGAQANIISDSPMGFLSSMLNNGFSIEFVNFLDR